MLNVRQVRRRCFYSKSKQRGCRRVHRTRIASQTQFVALTRARSYQLVNSTRRVRWRVRQFSVCACARQFRARERCHRTLGQIAVHRTSQDTLWLIITRKSSEIQTLPVRRGNPLPPWLLPMFYSRTPQASGRIPYFSARRQKIAGIELSC
jgi:hypothetical protein